METAGPGAPAALAVMPATALLSEAPSAVLGPHPVPGSGHVVAGGESDPAAGPSLSSSPGASGSVCLVNVLLFEGQDSELREGTSLGGFPGGGAVLMGLAATLEAPAGKARAGERPPEARPA